MLAPGRLGNGAPTLGTRPRKPRQWSTHPGYSTTEAPTMEHPPWVLDHGSPGSGAPTLGTRPRKPRQWSRDPSTRPQTLRQWSRDPSTRPRKPRQWSRDPSTRHPTLQYLAGRILHSRVISYLAPRTSYLDSYLLSKKRCISVPLCYDDASKKKNRKPMDGFR